MKRYCIVKKYIDKYDFDGLLEMGAPEDEYDVESQRIAEMITEDSSVDQIANAISVVMYQSMGSLSKTDVSNPGNFTEIATEIRNELWRYSTDERNETDTDI